MTVKENVSSGKGTRAWQISLALGILAMVGYALLPSETETARNLYYSAFGICAVAALYAGIRLNRPSRPLPWYLILAGWTMVVVGDAIWNYYEIFLKVESPFPSFADASYLGGWLVLTVGLAVLVGTRTAGRDRSGWIDATIIAVSLGLISWLYLMEPYANDASISLFARLVSISYPLVDVLLLALFARLLLAPGARSLAYVLVCVSLLSTLISDSFYAAAVLKETYKLGSPMDYGWLLAYTLWATAALHPSMRLLTEPTRGYHLGLTNRRIALLAAASLLAPGVLAIEHARGNDHNVPVILGGTVVLFLLSLVRLSGIMREHEASVVRERTLRRSSARLVAALDRESIYSAALEAALELTKGVPEVRVGLMRGSKNGMRVVASSGIEPARIEGKPFNVAALPEPLRARFLGQQPIDVAGDATPMRGALGLDYDGRPFFATPMFVQDELRGGIGTTSRAALPGTVREALMSLSSQVALALESAELREDLHQRRSEERFRSLVRHASDILMIMSTDGTVSYLSPAVEKVLGYKPEDVVDTDSFTPVHPDDDAQVRNVIAEAMSKPGSALRTELRLRHADGSWRHVESHFTSLLDEPTVRGIVINSRDITERKKAEKILRESEERYRAVVEQAGEGIFLFDPRTKRVLEANLAFREMLGYDAEELGRLTLYDLIPHDPKSVDRNVERTLEWGRIWIGERQYRRKDGSRIDVEVSGSVISYGGEEVVCSVVRDVTERKHSEEVLRRSEADLALAQRIAHLGSWEWNSLTGELLWSDETYRIFGLAPRELAPVPYEVFWNAVHPDDREPLDRAIRAALHEGRDYDNIVYRLVRPDGEIRFVSEQAEIMPDDAGRPVRMFGTVHDITERKALEDQLAYQAFHDALTGLPNRALFTDRLDHALARAERRGNSVAVLFLDLDRFKIVNDSLGHEVGDELLKAVGRRLQRCLRPEDTAARIGGDEFVVLLEDIESTSYAVRVAERIMAALRTPFDVAGHEMVITTSIGIALSSNRHGASELMRDADVAMYQAKDKGKARYQVFDPSMNALAMRRLELENQLRRGIEQGELKVYYQPKVEISGGRIVGMEALVRWQHPERGLISPAEFVPLAEETGLILPLGRWMLEEACRQAKEWQSLYSDCRPTMSVNLSGRQFQQPNLLEEISEVLEATELEPCGLVLEITESVIMEDAQANIATLEGLKDLGVKLAIDDFGTGYSSLDYLKRFPVDVIKIDRSFVHGLGLGPKETAIVQAVIDLAEALGLEPIAEGIENADQARQLQEMECHVGQGYYFARPLPSAEVTNLLLLSHH